MSESFKLSDYNHPYYGTTGCYYVGWPVGYPAPASYNNAIYDGNPCHLYYDSWLDFKDGNPRQFTAEEIAQRQSVGLTSHERSKDTFWDADQDYNLLYRWDVIKGEGDDNGIPKGKKQLRLFYIFQRKPSPMSVYVTIRTSDEAEIREWLFKRWLLMMRLWAPISGWPQSDPIADPAQGLDYAMCAMAGMIQSLKPSDTW